MAGSGTDYLPNPFASNTKLKEGKEKEEYLETLGIIPDPVTPEEETEYEGSSRRGVSTTRPEGASVSPSNLRRAIPVLRTLSGKAKPK